MLLFGTNLLICVYSPLLSLERTVVTKYPKMSLWCDHLIFLVSFMWKKLSWVSFTWWFWCGIIYIVIILLWYRTSSISIHTLIEISLLMVILTSSYISKFQIQVTNLAPLSISDYWKLENEYNAFRKIDQKAIKGWMSYDKMHRIAHMCGLLKSTWKLLLNPSQNMTKITMEIWTP